MRKGHSFTGINTAELALRKSLESPFVHDASVALSERVGICATMCLLSSGAAYAESAQVQTAAAPPD